MKDNNESRAPTVGERLAVMQNDLSYIKDEVKGVKEQIGSQYVTKAEFTPVKNVVYGLVAIILIAVVGGLLALVVKQ